MIKKLILTVALFITACNSGGLEVETPDVPATGRGGGTRLFPMQFPSPTGLKVSNGYNGIYYHGGSVMLGIVNVYYIWYGNWSNNTASTIMTNLAQNIGGSPYFNINTTYYDSNHNRISSAVSFGGSITDNYSYGTVLNDGGVAGIVQEALAKNLLPTDENGVYFVLASSDVNETSGFCSHYCGWHINGALNGHDIKYSFVGSPARCPNLCQAQAISPNNNAAADGMASIIAHELGETITDPDLNAWYDRAGNENGDKCAWTFGAVYNTLNGSVANMNLGGMDYLIQRNWVNAAGGYCALKY